MKSNLFLMALTLVLAGSLSSCSGCKSTPAPESEAPAAAVTEEAPAATEEAPAATEEAPAAPTEEGTGEGE